MDTGRLLLALGLARPARRRGFCPACRVGLTGVPPAVRGVELATDGITVAIVLGVAAVAWAVTAWQMLGSGMAMGLGSVASFATMWTVMMAAVMLPSAIPLVYRFARQAEGRRTRPVAVGMLGLVAMVLIGMTSLGWTIVLAALVLVYKFAAGAAWRLDVALAALVAVLGIVYAALA
jgi:predicted metal-binding membrane protein